MIHHPLFKAIEYSAESALGWLALINGGAFRDKVEYILLEEAKSAKRKLKKSAEIIEIVNVLKKLPPNQSGKIVAKTEKANTIKNQLVRVSKSLGLQNMTIKESMISCISGRIPIRTLTEQLALPLTSVKDKRDKLGQGINQ